MVRDECDGDVLEMADGHQLEVGQHMQLVELPVAQIPQLHHMKRSEAEGLKYPPYTSLQQKMENKGD